MNERERFEQWWENEGMDEKVEADYVAWLEVGNEDINVRDIQEWQKHMAEVAWKAAKESCRADIERKDEGLCFFSSVIKSGEPWTDECEEVLRIALSSEEVMHA